MTTKEPNSTGNNEVIQALIDYFEQNGWPSDLNLNKVWERSEVIDGPNSNPIVEIERHRSCLGAQYLKGLPMSAYHTYWMRYEVSLKSTHVHELPEKDGPINVNPFALVEELFDYEHFHLSLDEEYEEGFFTISESVSGQSRLVSTPDEVKEFLLLFKRPNLERFEIELDAFKELIENDDYKRLLVAFENALSNKLDEEARRLSPNFES
jgi:hypothetical protein